MFSGDLDDLLQQFPGIDCASRIIRVDNDDRFCPVCDLAADVIQIRVPLCLFIADIMYDFSASQGRGCSPKGVIRRRNQNLVTVIEQGLHAQID